jgi:hypothetical protein
MTGRDDIKVHLTTLVQKGARTFTEGDLAPCTARMSRQEARHYLDELVWEGTIAATIGRPGIWRVTESFHASVTGSVTPRENHPDQGDNPSSVT